MNAEDLLLSHEGFQGLTTPQEIYTRLSIIKDKIRTDCAEYKARKAENPLGFTDNWLPDMVEKMSINRAETDALMALNELPGIFCCNCGIKIYTDLTPVQYLEQSHCDLIICPSC